MENTSLTTPAEPTTATGHDHPDLAAPSRVVIAYDDIPAGRRAMDLLTRTLQLEPNAVHLFPDLWRFDLLEDPDWRAQALADAVAADLLILATSRPHPIPSSIDHWVSAFLSQRRGTSTAILASCGSGDEWSISVHDSADSPMDLPGNAASVQSDGSPPMQWRTAAA